MAKRLSKKKMELIENHAGGVDLMIERDAGNEVRVLTGRKDLSEKFWLDLRDLCEDALNLLDPNYEAQE